MKTYTEQEINDLKKSLAKAVRKELAKRSKDTAQEVVRDILDENFTAQIDPDKVPASGKTNVMNKSKSMKRQEKGVSKLKKFMHKKGK